MCFGGVLKKHLLIVILLAQSLALAKDSTNDCYEQIKAAEESQGLSDLENSTPVFGILEPRDVLPMCSAVENIYINVLSNIHFRYKAECKGPPLKIDYQKKEVYKSTSSLTPVTNITVWDKTKNGYRNFTVQELGDDIMLLFDEVYVPSSIVLRFPKAPLGFIRPCWSKLISSDARTLRKNSSIGILTYGSNGTVGAVSDYWVGILSGDQKTILWKKMNEIDPVTMSLVSAKGEAVPIKKIQNQDFGVDQSALPTEDQVKSYNIHTAYGALFVGFPKQRVLVKGIQ